MACVTACPSGVRYDRLIERARPQIERHHRRPAAERVLRRVRSRRTAWLATRLRALTPEELSAVEAAVGPLSQLLDEERP